MLVAMRRLLVIASRDWLWALALGYRLRVCLALMPDSLRQLHGGRVVPSPTAVSRRKH